MKFQAFAVFLMIALWCWALSKGVSTLLLALPTGLALGSFRLHTIAVSWRLFRACMYVMLVLVIAIHPASWGATPYARVLRQTLFDPLCALALLGIGIQLGAELNRAFAIARGRKRLKAIEAEFVGLLDRVTWTSARPA
jgi:hypothetical protein